MKRHAFGLSIMLGVMTLAPAAGLALPPQQNHRPLPQCTDLAALIAHPVKMLAATSEVRPPAGGVPGYCEVNLTLYPAINIRVGLPLSDADGGAGGVQGAWNGRVQNLGGGGYSGTVGSVTGAIATGYVGSSTDTGHSRNWCNAINPKTGQPNSQPDCGLAGGGFVLDPDNNLLSWQVQDFIRDAIHQQTLWALHLTERYFGMRAERNYWNGCSTGGRQGFQMAQSFGQLFDGILVGAPAMNWNRFIIGELWPPVVVKDVVGPGGLSAAKYNAANAAAIAACDADDGVVDGLLNEPRRCDFDAYALVCTGGPGDPATCLTEAEADAVNMIWDGPRNEMGERLWGGVAKGTTFGILLNPDPASPVADLFGLITTYVQNWMHQDPTFDWHQVTLDTYTDEFHLSERKFKRTASTDDPKLDVIRAHGGKILLYHGIGDPLIVPFGTYNYVARVFDRFGLEDTQTFLRSFFYPGVGHCGGGAPGTPLIDRAALFDVLVDWVESDVAPDHVVASSSDGSRTRKICKYPDEAVYLGSGSTDDHNNFVCIVNTTLPMDLAEDSLTERD